MRDLLDDATWEDDLTNLGPEVGDDANGEEVSVIGDKMGNRTRYLYGQVQTLITPEILARHQWHPRPLFNCAFVPYTDAWAGTAADYMFGAVSASGAGAYAFECEIELAHGAELNQVRVYVYDGNNDNAVAATVTVWKIALATYTDHGGDLHELPTATLLGSSPTYTHVTGESFGYIGPVIGGTEIVDRSAYRYVVQVYGTGLGAAENRWFSTRVLTLGGIDKGAA